MVVFSSCRSFLWVLFSLSIYPLLWSQSADTSVINSTFSGALGITNNGFSIIPTFSLNSPAAVIAVSWRTNRFSFEPDIRLTPDVKKGGMLWWLRYRLIEKQKFSLRVGAHPAFTLINRSDTELGETKDITEMLRFVAFEVVPGYQINQHWGVSAMYLEGHALQKHGPQLTRVLFLNLNLTEIALSNSLRVHAFPSVYYLFTDGYRGTYGTVTGVLAHKKWPFSLQSTINQTFSSDLPDNKEFLWNVTLNYNFNKTYQTTKIRS